MNYEKFQEAVDSFIEDNIEIVEEYNSLHEIPMNQLTYRLYKTVCPILDSNKKKTVKNLLADLLPLAISSKIDLINAAEDWSDLKESAPSVKSDKNALQIYFNEVKDIYDKNGNDYNIEYSKENRDKIIEMNLKSVISIAKKYKGLGVPMEDLIAAGNLGLCVAFDKFDPSRTHIKDNLLKEINNIDKEEFTYEECKDILEDARQYGTTKEAFHIAFEKDQTYTKKDLIKWVKKNVINARFNSVAVMWIRAYILIELNNNSRPIKKTKSDIKDEKEFGKDVYININDRFGDSGNNTIGDVLYVEDDTVSEQERVESKMIFKEGLAKLMDGIKVRDRRILMQKFGIGYPRPMTPKEISQMENLSFARISQIVMNSIEKMKKNQEKWNIDPQIMYQACEKLY